MLAIPTSWEEGLSFLMVSAGGDIAHQSFVASALNGTASEQLLVALGGQFVPLLG